MIERIIEFIGKVISSIFSKSNEIIEDMKIEASMTKKQVQTSSINLKATLMASVNDSSCVNYFNNRVIGEFLRIISKVVPYEKDFKTGKYVVYFIRHKKRSCMEYIKFSKDSVDSKNVDIYYTVINKMFSSTGITTYVGNTSSDVILTDKTISSCILDSISGCRAPLYMVTTFNNKVGVGNPTLIYDCWVLSVKVIMSEVEKYFNNKDSSYTDKVDKLMEVAGMHMFMSYFKSLSNPFYSRSYLDSEISDLSSAIKEYNLSPFNTNKIISFKFDGDKTTPCLLVYNNEKDKSTIRLYGIELVVTGKVTGSSTSAAKMFNYKMASSLLKAEDYKLRRNFLFYILSTGGLDDCGMKDFERSYNTGLSKKQDGSMDEFTDIIEPTVESVMEESGFKQDEDGEFESKEFERFICDNVSSKMNDKDMYKPEVIQPIKVCEDKKSISELFGKLPNQEVDSKPANVESLENNRVKDNISLLREQFMESYNVSNITEDATSISKPLISWTFDECLKAISGDLKYSDSINKEDIISRIRYLRETNEE